MRTPCTLPLDLPLSCVTTPRVKPNPIVTRSHKFSRALRRLHIYLVRVLIGSKDCPRLQLKIALMNEKLAEFKLSIALLNAADIGKINDDILS